MLISDFDFELPSSLIAETPAEPRDHSRLLVCTKSSESFSHKKFFELPELLKQGDLLIRNNTKVIPARLFAKSPKGAIIEVFLLSPQTNSNAWRCLVKPGKKVKDQLSVSFDDGTAATITRHGDEFSILFPSSIPDTFFSWLDRVGHTPLPPYIKRADTEADRTRYQTVYAKMPGSVAAPTAGLHFTDSLLASLDAGGVETAEVTLHVGPGTFAPVKTDALEDHRMHFERYFIPESTLHKIEAAKKCGGRVIAVGTTSLRTLESMPQFGTEGSTNLFIKPGDSFKVIDGLITNFHLPKSTLFVLVSALMGRDRAFRAYREAIDSGYRFYSYGDAMLIL